MLSSLPHTKDNPQRVGADALPKASRRTSPATRTNTCVPERGVEERRVSWGHWDHSMNALWQRGLFPEDRRDVHTFKPREDWLWEEGYWKEGKTGIFLVCHICLGDRSAHQLLCLVDLGKGNRRKMAEQIREETWPWSQRVYSTVVARMDRFLHGPWAGWRHLESSPLADKAPKFLRECMYGARC